MEPGMVALVRRMEPGMVALIPGMVALVATLANDPRRLLSRRTAYRSSSTTLSLLSGVIPWDAISESTSVEIGCT